MSAYICSDKHIATIACNYVQLFEQTESAQEIADALLACNIASVNYRYGEDTEITPCSLAEADFDRSFEDLAALCTCLDYQSCELPGYQHPLLDAITAQFKANCRIGIKSPLWSI